MYEDVHRQGILYLATLGVDMEMFKILPLFESLLLYSMLLP